MRINIFDNGLQRRTGHHFDFCRKLALAFRQRGLAVEVYGAHGADAAIGEALAADGSAFTPLFSRFAYAPVSAANNADLGAAFVGLAQDASREMSQAAPAQLNLFPTLKPLEFLAFSLAPLPGTTVGYVHNEPSNQNAASGEFWALASETLRSRGAHFRLGAIDPVVADFLGGYLEGLPVETFPMPYDGPPRAAYRERAQTVGFFGSQREERGMGLLAPLIEQLIAQGYEVALHDTHGQFTNASGTPKLRILDAFVDDLEAEIRACDIVVCPMLRENYMHRMSGIAAAAVATGVPLILPAGTLAAARFHGLGSSRCYREHTPQGVLRAILKLAQDYPRHTAAAALAAQQWNIANGMGHFVDEILKHPAP